MENGILIQGITLNDLMESFNQSIDSKLSKFFEKEKESTEDILVTEKEACNILKVTRQTLKNHRDAGLIKYSRVGGAIRYSRNEITKQKVKA